LRPSSEKEIAMRRMLWRTFLLIGALLSTVSAAPTALTQEGTPVAGVCDAPELPPGTPTPVETMAEGAASPMAEEAAASPMAEATPGMASAPEIPTGTPADAETTELVTAAVANVFACLSEGNHLGVAALYTTAGLMEDFGTGNPYDLEQFLPQLPPTALVSVSDVQVLDDGRYSADVVYSFGGIQLLRERWLLVAADRFLLIDSTPDLAVEAPEGSVTIAVEMVDFAYELSQETAPANTPLVFEVTNTGQYPHELVLVQMDESANPEMLLTGELTFEDIGIYGATFSEGGQPAPPLVLMGLNPGTYYLICMIDVPDGVPHLARGMVAELTIEE
jgi:hypothetical protein